MPPQRRLTAWPEGRPDYMDRVVEIAPPSARLPFTDLPIPATGIVKECDVEGLLETPLAPSFEDSQGVEVCIWPIGRVLLNTDKDNPPDVRHLCFLDPKDVYKYETWYFFLNYQIQPVQNRGGRLLAVKGYNHARLFGTFKTRNWSSNIQGKNSLMNTADHRKTKMQNLVDKHNKVAQRKNLRERAAATRAFLLLIRQAPKDSSTHNPPMPLVPAKKVILVFPRGTTEADMDPLDRADFKIEGFQGPGNPDPFAPRTIRVPPRVGGW